MNEMFDYSILQIPEVHDPFKLMCVNLNVFGFLSPLKMCNQSGEIKTLFGYLHTFPPAWNDADLVLVSKQTLLRCGKTLNVEINRKKATVTKSGNLCSLATL